MMLTSHLIPAGRALIASALFSALIAAQAGADEITWIPKVDTAPVIDGEIDQIWHAQPPFRIEYVQNGTVDDEDDLSAWWYGLYDADNFYFLIDIRDDVLESEAGAAEWQNDRIEVFFNMDNVKPGGNSRTGNNYQYVFPWNRTAAGVSANGSLAGVEWIQVTTEAGWRVEVKIPWATLIGSWNLQAVEGFSFGFDVSIIDNDGNPSYDAIVNWWNTSGTHLFSNIDGAGTVGLGPPFDGNYAPVVEDPGTQVAWEGASSSIIVTATDYNSGDEITFDAEDLPSFASIATNPNRSATITVDAEPGDAGFYFFTVFASDGTLEGSAKITLIVRDPALGSQPPVFEFLADVPINQGDQRIIDILVTDNDSLEVAITAAELPGFGTLEDHGDMTATISFQPAFDVSPGDYAVTLVATDEDGNTDTLSFSVVVSEPGQSGEFYCDPDIGSMGNDGSPESPWGTLQAVFESGKLFRPGDVIHLRDGYHGEPVISGHNSDTVYIVAADDAHPTMSRLTYSSSSSNWRVTGVEISRSHAPVFSRGTAVTINGTYNTLADCVIHSAPDSSGWSVSDWLARAGNGVQMHASHSLLENCTILNTYHAVTASRSAEFSVVRGNHIQHFGGDAIRGLGNDQRFEYNYIADCYNIDDNHDDGFQSWSDGPGGPGSGTVYRVVVRGNVIVQTTNPNRPLNGHLQGIGLFDGMFEDWLVENNVVVSNSFHGITFLGAINSRVINNTVIDINGNDNRMWIQMGAHKNGTPSTGNLVRNNLMTRLNTSAAAATIDNNRTIGAADHAAYFIGFPHDMRLRPDSPAIDAGTNNGAPAFDADGLPRPVDGTGDGMAITDLGAYEFRAQWRGMPIIDGWVQTGARYFGWLWVAFDPWQYALAFQDWVYLPESHHGEQAGYAWFPNYGDGPVGWIRIPELDTWAYKYSEGSGGWMYVLNSAGG